LHERFAGHWAQHCLTVPDGLVFPFSIERLRSSFEAATDACVADLSQLLDSLPPEHPEWSGSGDPCGRQAVEAVQKRMWLLRPPYEEWLVLQRPTAFWSAARQYLSANLSGASAPCPAQWVASAPVWDERVLRVLAPTRPRLVSGWLPPRRAPETQPFPALPLSASKTLRRKASPVSAGRDSSSGTAGSDRGPCGDGHADNTSPAALELEGSMAGEPPLKRRRLASVTRMLQMDAAWTDSLLRGAALLAAGVPSGF